MDNFKIVISSHIMFIVPVFSEVLIKLLYEVQEEIWAGLSSKEESLSFMENIIKSEFYIPKGRTEETRLYADVSYCDYDEIHCVLQNVLQRILTGQRYSKVSLQVGKRGENVPNIELAQDGRVLNVVLSEEIWDICLGEVDRCSEGRFLFSTDRSRVGLLREFFNESGVDVSDNYIVKKISAMKIFKNKALHAFFILLNWLCSKPE